MGFPSHRAQRASSSTRHGPTPQPDPWRTRRRPGTPPDRLNQGGTDLSLPHDSRIRVRRNLRRGQLTTMHLPVTCGLIWQVSCGLIWQVARWRGAVQGDGLQRASCERWVAGGVPGGLPERSSAASVALPRSAHFAVGDDEEWGSRAGRGGGRIRAPGGAIPDPDSPRWA